MFGTTKLFLDYFGLKKLDDLPPLADLSDWESLRVQLNLPDVDAESGDDDGGVTGEIMPIPVLFPLGTNDPDFADLSESDSDHVPMLNDENQEEASAREEFTEIAATEWPDPLEEDDELADDDMELGADASASRQ
jgi:segregation and condensation protein B